MRSLVKKQKTFYGILTTIGCLVVALIAFFAVTPPARAESAGPQSGDRLITVHDGGVERAFMTHAGTLGDALKQANFHLDPQDAVEPGLDSKLVAANYEVNIYRARPVTIVDGVVREKVLSSARTAPQIAKAANITLYPEDQASLNVAAGADSGLQMTVKRATPFTFTLYGKTITARTQAATVGAMLKEKGIKLAGDDRVSVANDTPITSDLTVRVWREGKQTITVDEAVPFTTDQIKDADQPVGYKQVQTQGVDGSQSVTYEIVIQDGKEVSRTKIAAISTKEMVKQVEVVGTKYELPAGSHTDWMAAAGISASDYGFVDYIVSHEGGWCPVRWQGDPGCIDHGSAPSVSGYGLVQATPGNKMASAGADWLTNPVTQLRWATGYAVGRYGSWQGAYNHWLASHNW